MSYRIFRFSFGSFIIVTIDDAVEMIDQVDSDKLKIIFDSAMLNILGLNFSDFLKRIPQHLAYVHVSDNDGIPSGPPVHLPPGKGTIDWARFLSVLKEINYQGYLIVQMFMGWMADIDSWAISSKKFIEKVFEEI